MPLWIVATPIGTLADLSPRAADTLRRARIVLAEDTRHTMGLLSAHDITGPQLVALHAHNEANHAEEYARRALTDEVALVSDAGTPGISDPGRLVIAAAHALGVEIRSVPGPSALAAALAASGFPAAPSTFLGFPPRKGRDEWATQTLSRGETLVLYEAPDRVADVVAALAALDPGREACLCREISKRYEELLRRPLGALAADLNARERILGECVLVVGPGEPLAPRVVADLPADAGLKDVAAALAHRWGARKQDLYRELLAMKDRLEGP